MTKKEKENSKITTQDKIRSLYRAIVDLYYRQEIELPSDFKEVFRKESLELEKEEELVIKNPKSKIQKGKDN